MLVSEAVAAVSVGASATLVAPLAGLTFPTPVGAVVSLFVTVTFTAADVVEFAAASLATAVSAWEPSEVVVEFHEML